MTAIKNISILLSLQRYMELNHLLLANTSAEWQNIGTTLIEENSEWNVVGHRYGIDYDSASGKTKLIQFYINSITNHRILNLRMNAVQILGESCFGYSDFTINGYDYDKISVWIHPDNQINMMFYNAA